MLSCDCFYDFSKWYCDAPDGFIIYKRLIGKRCCSCGKMVKYGDICAKFPRYREVRSDIEERIYGDDVPLAPYYMCEKCGEIYLNLSVLGFYLDIEESMTEALSNYWELTGFKKEEKHEF